MNPHITLLHNPNCSKSRALKAALDERGAEYTERLYLEHPLSVDELAQLQRQLGLPNGEAGAMVRAKEAAFAEAGLEAGSSDADLLEAIARHPILLERPVLVVGDRAAIGRPAPQPALDLL